MITDGFLLTALGTSHYTFSRHLTNQFGPVGPMHSPSSVAKNGIEALTQKNINCFILVMYLKRTKPKQSLHTRLYQKTKS